MLRFGPKFMVFSYLDGSKSRVGVTSALVTGEQLFHFWFWTRRLQQEEIFFPPNRGSRYKYVRPRSFLTTSVLICRIVRRDTVLKGGKKKTKKETNKKKHSKD